MLYFDQDVTENQHAVKILTQKGICGAILTEQYLPSGEHKNYDHFNLLILQILSTFQVNNFHVTILCIHNMLSGGNQTNGNSYSQKISDPFKAIG